MKIAILPKKWMWLVAALLGLNGVWAENSKALPMGEKGTLTIADFDSWEDVNNLGGIFGAWCRNPEDPSQQCLIELTDEIKAGEKGNSLRLNYRVDSPTQAFNGLWMKLMETDFSRYTYLVISIKGDKEAGFTPRFKIEMKNKQRETGRFIVTGVTDKWQQFVIPLKEFKGLNDFRGMTELVIVFDDTRCRPKVGQLYIDNLYLSP